MKSRLKKLSTLFNALKDNLREKAGNLGLSHIRDIVGRTEYLKHTRETDRVDCSSLLTPASEDAETTERKKDRLLGRKKIRRPLTSLTKMISTSITKQIERGYREVIYDDEEVTNVDRAIGTHLSGVLARQALKQAQNGDQTAQPTRKTVLNLNENRVPGNGLGAFNGLDVHIIVQGGAQDGTCEMRQRRYGCCLKG